MGIERGSKYRDKQINSKMKEVGTKLINEKTVERCGKCGFRINGANHDQGMHHIHGVKGQAKA